MIRRIRKTEFLTEDRLIHLVNWLLLVATILIVYGSCHYVTDSVYESELYKEPVSEKTAVEVVEVQPVFIPQKSKALMGYTELLDAIISLPVTYTSMNFEYCGRHYITAYCPEECGYRVYSDGSDNFPAGWVTASDTICHYSEDNSEATTCAIDLDNHSFGEYLWIDGKLYITEDTGPGVQGAWVDVFRPDYDSMASFGSHYSIVYSVSFEDHTTEGGLLNELITDYLLRTMPGYWNYSGDGD